MRINYVGIHYLRYCNNEIIHITTLGKTDTSHIYITVQGTKAVDPIKLGMSFFAIFSVSFLYFAFSETVHMLCKPDL